MMSKMESSSPVKQSHASFQNSSASQSLEKSQTIKLRKQQIELEFAQSALNKSMEKESSAKQRQLELEAEKKANMGRIDERLKEIHRSVEGSH